MTKLSNIRELGRYKNTITGKEYNLKKGTNKQRGTDSIFYTYRGKREFISDADFYHIYEKIKNIKSSEIIAGESKSDSILSSVDYPRGVRINNNTSNVIKTFHS